jgi:hypothetical protein
MYITSIWGFNRNLERSLIGKQFILEDFVKKSCKKTFKEITETKKVPCFKDVVTFHLEKIKALNASVTSSKSNTFKNFGSNSKNFLR